MLEPKMFVVLEECAIQVIIRLEQHIKKKAEKIVTFYDAESGWVLTQ